MAHSGVLDFLSLCGAELESHRSGRPSTGGGIGSRLPQRGAVPYRRVQHIQWMRGCIGVGARLWRTLAQAIPAHFIRTLEMSGRALPRDAEGEVQHVPFNSYEMKQRC